MKTTTRNTLPLLLLLLLTFCSQVAWAKPPKPSLKPPTGWKQSRDGWNALSPTLVWKAPKMGYTITWETYPESHFQQKLKGSKSQNHYGSIVSTSLTDWTETTVQGRKAWTLETATKLVASKKTHNTNKASTYEKKYFVVQNESYGRFEGFEITFAYQRPGVSTFIRKNPKSVTLKKLLENTVFPAVK